MIQVIQGDITKLAVDAIVNAANNSLSNGAGVNGAIHRAAGPELDKACQQLGGCRTGEAVITPGFHLPAKYIIHTVGPVWHGGGSNEAKLLANCYKNCLDIAKKHQLQSIAFPAISCGVFGYPIEEATQIAIKTVQDNLKQTQFIQKIIFVCFEDEVFQAYHSRL